MGKGINNAKFDQYSRQDIPNIGIVGATVGCGPIAAVRSAVFATLSKTIICKIKKHMSNYCSEIITSRKIIPFHTLTTPQCI